MKQLEKALEQLNIPYDDEMIGKFKKYMDEILRWNKMVNITSIKEEQEFIKKHYIDSLLCVGFPEFQEAKKILDMGTGGGFPGVPLAIIAPNKKFILMDSLNKRVKIIQEICSDLGINNVRVIHGRAEEWARKKGYRESYGLCISRAVANLATLSEYCLPYVELSGSFLAYKGAECDEEIQASKNAIDLLGGQIQRQEKVQLSGFDLNHQIIVIGKVNKTPPNYPRKAGIPSKEPLK
ncbi:MAG: 16S rRNA (guanine(527)-N(7))-methyltransferase RsmG [Anaerovoracaceae bacterium]